jgi:hemoglobin
MPTLLAHSRRVLVVLSLALAPGLAPHVAVAADGPLTPVFEQFGGKAGLARLMDDFMDNLLADPRTKPFFADRDEDRIKLLLAEQFCALLDGPCAYNGRDMKVTHADLAIHEEHFNALVEDLQRAMDKNGIAFAAQNKLLARLAPMYRVIITR